MRHSWRGRQQPASWAPLQSCRGRSRAQEETTSLIPFPENLFLVVPILTPPGALLLGGMAGESCESQQPHLEGTGWRNPCRGNPRQNCLARIPAQRPRGAPPALKA